MKKTSSHNGEWKRYWLMPIDVVGGFAAFIIATKVLFSNTMIDQKNLLHDESSFLYLLSAPLLLLIFRSVGLYSKRELFYGTQEYVKIIKGLSFFCLALLLLTYGFDIPHPPRTWLLSFWILSTFMVSLERFLLRRLLRMVWKTGKATQRVLILGANNEARVVSQRLEQTRMVEIIGFLDEFSPLNEEVWEGRKVLGVPSQYIEIAKRLCAELVVLVPEANGWETQQEILRKAATNSEVEVMIAPGFNELYSVSMGVCFKGNVPLLHFRPGYASGLDAVLKMVMDYSVGIVLLFATAPLMLLLGLLLWLESGRPIVQGFPAVGRNGHLFKNLKFRVGLNHPPSDYRSFRRRGTLDSYQGNLGYVGGFLFRTGFDKIPQLLNVLTGTMSLVGPRPVPVEAGRQYEVWLPGILAVKPGVTGTWALYEAGGLDQEISHTLYYVRTWSIWHDLNILAKTALEMVRTRFCTRPLPENDKMDLSDVNGRWPCMPSTRNQDLGQIVYP